MHLRYGEITTTIITYIKQHETALISIDGKRLRARQVRNERKHFLQQSLSGVDDAVDEQIVPALLARDDAIASSTRGSPCAACGREGRARPRAQQLPWNPSYGSTATTRS